MTERFRPNVAVIVTDGRGRVLLCVRTDAKYSPHPQTVQGGIDPGESPRDAAVREMREELGLQNEEFEITGELSEAHPYRWDAQHIREVASEFVGQEQRFFLARVISGVKFDLAGHHGEFSRVWWGTAKELLDNCWPPKRPGFQAALTAFGLLKGEEV